MAWGSGGWSRSGVLLGRETRRESRQKAGKKKRPERAGDGHDRLDEVGCGGFQSAVKFEVIDMQMFLLQNAGNTKNTGTSVQWT